MSNDDLPRSHSEQTDSTKLGETIGDLDPTGDAYPAEAPLGVEDPDIRADGSIARDDVETRDARQRPETGDRPPRDETRHDIMDTSTDPDRLDDESEMLGIESDSDSDAAEVTAIHELPDERR